MTQETRSEKLIIAVPAGPRVPDGPRHSEGSRLAVPTHRFLRKGCGLSYSMPYGKYYGLVKWPPIEIAEFKGSDIPIIVAEGSAHVGITGLDKALDLPDEEFRDGGAFQNIEILRKLGFGQCELRLGVPKGSGYSTLESVAGLRVATALPRLTRRIFRERGVPAQLVVRGGHVENVLRYGEADVIVDITETGGTMRRHGLVPQERLESFEAILIRSADPFSLGREAILRNLLHRVDRALQNRSTWTDSRDNGSPFTAEVSPNTLGAPSMINEPCPQATVAG